MHIQVHVHEPIAKYLRKYVNIYKLLTKNSEHHAVLEHLHGARADEEEGLQCIPLPQEVFSGGTKGCLYVQRQGAQTTPAQTGEDGQLQDFLIQVHSDVRTQFIGKVFQ